MFSFAGRGQLGYSPWGLMGYSDCRRKEKAAGKQDAAIFINGRLGKGKKLD